MNLNLNYEGFESNLICRVDIMNGVGYRFRFANDYGASVIKHWGSYGHEHDLWELAVLHFNSDDEFNNGRLTYDTFVTDDVIGFCTDETIRLLLQQIKEL